MMGISKAASMLGPIQIDRTTLELLSMPKLVELVRMSTNDTNMFGIGVVDVGRGLLNYEI